MICYNLFLFIQKTQNIEKYKTNYNIKRLADFDIECKRELHHLEIKCRQELHEQQLEVEKKKLRNLDRELELINKKIEFQNKNIGMYFIARQYYNVINQLIFD